MKPPYRPLAALLFCAIAAGNLHAGNYYAARLGPDNLHRLPEGGLDAIGGSGDWLLTDGELCAVVSGKGHQTYLAPTGGALVDLWHCARADDQWNVAHTQFNMQKDEIPPTREITAGFGAADAWVETRGSRAGLEAVVRYRLSADHPGELEITSTVTRRTEGERMGMFGSLVLHPSASLTPFTVDTRTGEQSTGFDQPEIDTSDRSSVLAAISTADLQVLLGSRHIRPPISYGLHVEGALHRDAAGGERPLHHFLISGRTFTLFGAFTRPFPRWWPRTPGLVSLALGQLFDLQPGSSFLLTQRIAVGHGDVASITDRLYGGALVSGTLDTAEAGIAVTGPGGEALTFARPDAGGGFRFRLPAGIHDGQLEVRTARGGTALPFEAPAAANDLGALQTGAPAVLALPRGEPMSLVFLREASGEVTQPVFHDEFTGTSVAGERRLVGAENHRLNLSGSPRDPAEVALPPGHYSVLASRGPEYGVTRREVSLVAGERTLLDIDPPPRAITTPGLLSADFHVHSGVSFDSSLPLEQRVADFMAQGCEVLVPTEHNITYDLRPTIAALGLDGAIFSFPGVEITGMARSEQAPTTIGHSNVFPVEADPDAFMGGTLPFEGRRLGQVIDAYKARFPGSLFQLNHPRTEAFDDDITFFNHLSQGLPFDPDKPLEAAPNNFLLQRHPGSAFRDIDFDALELLNGPSMAIYELVRRDWFALLRQDQYKVATANSDSHASHQLVAYPRSFVELAEDDPAAVDPGELSAAIARGAVYGSTGPVLRVDVAGTGPGGTHAGGRGNLRIAVAAADWIPVETARIWLNGELWRELPVSGGDTLETAIEVETDSFVFVEVTGAPSATYRAIAPGFTPFAFANPVFLDVAGDGWRYGEKAH